MARIEAFNQEDRDGMRQTMQRYAREMGAVIKLQSKDGSGWTPAIETLTRAAQWIRAYDAGEWDKATYEAWINVMHWRDGVMEDLDPLWIPKLIPNSPEARFVDVLLALDNEEAFERSLQNIIAKLREGAA